MTDFPPASEIMDDLLNWTGQALIDADFEAFLPHFVLPQVLETFEGPRNVKTVDNMKALFQSVCAFHKSRGVNRLVRSCRYAVYKDEDNIEGVLDALLFNGNELVHNMPSTFVMLTRHDDVWKIIYNMYGVNDDDGFGRALIHAPDLPGTPVDGGFSAQLKAS